MHGHKIRTRRGKKFTTFDEATHVEHIYGLSAMKDFYYATFWTFLLSSIPSTTRDENFSWNVKTVGNIPEISEKKIGNIPKFSDLEA